MDIGIGVGIDIDICKSVLFIGSHNNNIRTTLKFMYYGFMAIVIWYESDYQKVPPSRGTYPHSFLAIEKSTNR